MTPAVKCRGTSWSNQIRFRLGCWFRTSWRTRCQTDGSKAGSLSRRDSASRDNGDCMRVMAFSSAKGLLKSPRGVYEFSLSVPSKRDHLSGFYEPDILQIRQLTNKTVARGKSTLYISSATQQRCARWLPFFCRGTHTHQFHITHFAIYFSSARRGNILCNRAARPSRNTTR